MRRVRKAFGGDADEHDTPTNMMRNTELATAVLLVYAVCEATPTSAGRNWHYESQRARPDDRARPHPGPQDPYGMTDLTTLGSIGCRLDV